MSEFTLVTFVPPPPPAGYWVLSEGGSAGRLLFAIYRKPNRFHRFMTKLLLNWDWKDNY